MLRKWTKIYRRTKQDITKGRRTYWPTDRPTTPLQTQNFGPRIELESHPEKQISWQSETVKKSRLLNAIIPTQPLPAKRSFVSSLPLSLLCYLVDLNSREQAPNPEAKRRDPVIIRCTTFCLITFHIKIDSVPTHITHITMVAASKVGATSQAIKYEPLICDCKLTKRNEVWGAKSRFGLKAQAIYFYEEEEEMTRNECNCALSKKSFLCLTQTRLRFVVIFCTFGAGCTGNFISWIHNLVSNTCY